MARNNGAPGEIRTPDRPVRSRVLYPAELRARCSRARQMSAREGCELSVGGIRLSTIPAAILQLIYTSYPVLQELGQPPTTFVPKTAPKPAIFLFQVDFKPHGTDNPLPFSSPATLQCVKLIKCNNPGEVAEWLKAHAWKACIR